MALPSCTLGRVFQELVPTGHRVPLTLENTSLCFYSVDGMACTFPWQVGFFKCMLSLVSRSAGVRAGLCTGHASMALFPHLHRGLLPPGH